MLLYKLGSDGKLNRLLILLIYRFVTSRYVSQWYKHPGSVAFISSKLCVKSTGFTTLAEAETMKFISKNTTIPVPTIYDAFEHKNRVYIVMERISGQSLSFGWGRRSAESKKIIFKQLRSMVDEMRNLPPPPDSGVSNISGGPIFDLRLPKDALWGPFPSVHDFHRELRNGIDSLKDDSQTPGLKDLITFHEQTCDRPVFTHGDLSSLNILVNGDTVVGIIDWETAGWMPSYWEYTSAWDANPQNRFWQQEVDNFLTPRPYDAQMEIIRKKYFGDF